MPKTYAERKLYNENLCRTWQDDEDTEYVRCVLASMRHASINPNVNGARDLSPSVAREWARGEAAANVTGRQRELCDAACAVLNALADKLYDLGSEDV